MPATRVQTLRSSTALQRPPAGQSPGVLYVNWPDKQLGVIDSTQTPQDLIGGRFFSALTHYNIGDYVFNAGQLYRANAAISPGAFNSAQWDALATQPYVNVHPDSSVANAAPASPVQGQLWWDTVSGQLYVYQGTTWVIAVNIPVPDSSTFLPTSGGTITGSLTVAGSVVIGQGQPVGGSSATVTLPPDATAGNAVLFSPVSYYGYSINAYWDATANTSRQLPGTGTGNSGPAGSGFIGVGGNPYNFFFQLAPPAADNAEVTPVTVAVIDGAGNMAIQGTLSQASDPALKKDIADAPAGALAKVAAIPVKTYAGKQDDVRHTGWLATDVRKIHPDAVTMHTDEKGRELNLALYPSDMTAILWQAVQELAAKVAALEAGGRA